jgi:hypothetical protein
VPEIGDHVQLAAVRVDQAPRTGVVTAVRGAMITVRWPSGEQSVVVPAPGTLTVIGRGTPKKAVPKATVENPAPKAPAPKAAKRTPSKKAAR